MGADSTYVEVGRIAESLGRGLGTDVALRSNPANPSDTTLWVNATINSGTIAASEASGGTGAWAIYMSGWNGAAIKDGSIVFGVDESVNLYKDAANVLKTDDTLRVGADFAHQGSNLGFFNTAPTTKKTVTGSRGANAALTSLLTQLASYGLITDSSS